jgi:hypothetical protein
LKRGGGGINESRPSRGRDETAFDDGVRTLEETGAENPEVGKMRQRPSREKLRRSAGAKRRTEQVGRSFRTRSLRSFLAGCAAVGGIRWLVSGARQSAASSSSRAPPKNEDEKTGETNRSRERGTWTRRRLPGSQPRPDVQEGRPAVPPRRIRVNLTASAFPERAEGLFVGS